MMLVLKNKKRQWIILVIFLVWENTMTKATFTRKDFNLVYGSRGLESRWWSEEWQQQQLRAHISNHSRRQRKQWAWHMPFKTLKPVPSITSNKTTYLLILPSGPYEGHFHSNHHRMKQAPGKWNLLREWVESWIWNTWERVFIMSCFIV